MPEMHFVARWPDGTRQTYYSPSLVIDDYLAPGTAYTVPDFVVRCRAALAIASQRVQAKYGFACTRAAQTLADIETKAGEFSGQAGATVQVEPQRDRGPFG